MNLVNKISESIITSPTLIQVSINGIWEDSWVIPFQDSMPSIDAIEKYLEKGTERIAFEVFFKTHDNYTLFFGARFTEDLLSETPKKFLISSFKTIWSETSPSFKSLITQLSQKLIGKPYELFGIPPTSIELGVVNYWKSIGSTVIWKQTEIDNISRVKLREKLKQHPLLVTNTSNYVVMELNYNVKPHYWLGIQISDKEGENYILNDKRLELLLEELLNISIV